MKTLTAASIGAAAALAGAYVAARPRFLEWGSTEEERRRSWPGDSLARAGRAISMRAITIDAPPAAVWPWIVQIGYDRAGFYGCRPLESAAGARMPQIEEIVPEFQQRYIGDTVWLSHPEARGGKAKLVVGYLRENRAMILVSAADWERVLREEPIAGKTWGFILEPAGEGRTRLVLRSVSQAGPLSAVRLAGYARELADFATERRLMLRVKELAERSAVPAVTLEAIEIEVEPA